MSLSIAYETLDDARMRLQNTIVLYDGEPVYITEIGQMKAGDPKEDIYRVYAAPLPYEGEKGGLHFNKARVELAAAHWDAFIERQVGRPVHPKPAPKAPPEPAPEDPKELLRKFISSKKFDMAPFPMGFVNTESGVFYCQRRPRRQQRQGLSHETFLGQPVGRNFEPLAFHEILNSPEFVDCVKGKYPTYNDSKLALEIAKDSVSVAFDRHFALVKDEHISELLYIYHKKEKVGFVMEGKVKLANNGQCLRESLKELNVPC
jgi:hypothetical protein